MPKVKADFNAAKCSRATKMPAKMSFWKRIKEKLHKRSSCLSLTFAPLAAWQQFMPLRTLACIAADRVDAVTTETEHWVNGTFVYVLNNQKKLLKIHFTKLIHQQTHKMYAINNYKLNICILRYCPKILKNSGNRHLATKHLEKISITQSICKLNT